MFEHYYSINFMINVYSLTYMFAKGISLYFVAVIQSRGGLTFSLMLVFQGQAIYKSYKQIGCRKM